MKRIERLAAIASRLIVAVAALVRTVADMF